ncbi:hypothetical protein [Ktedonospora formicarum]|uniref:Uncharacterized protein n=1 Tax=Ktedonospora formicarum TaxID=2778364 RepID=A0A8J3I0A5_9CHLR|nr:hypothetical protein [Ktedonospora formicarum]GHO46446.1 hypothetical protein KSX_46090 [Ktedonospora formicarum]
MPKEPKKFINPLLRPSSVADRSEQAEEKPARKHQAETPILPSPSPTESATGTPDQETRSGEGRVTEQVSMAPVRASGKRASNSRIEDEHKVETPNVQPSPRPVKTDTQTSSDTYTFTDDAEHHQRVNALPHQDEEAPLPQRSKAQTSRRGTTLANVLDSSSQTVPLYSDQIEPQNQVEIPYQRIVDEYRMIPQRQAPNDEDNFSIEPTASSPFAPAANGQYPRDLLDGTTFSAQGAVRRRRGAQTFERTHERITLWIDKRLKQAFDELANDRELPKTALLNEAIADLLRKYRS